MLNSPTTNETESPYLSWTKDLAIGHPLIDADHQHIFDIANRLQAEILEEPEHSIVGEVLVELIEHTGAHFLREEAVMQAMRFPLYEMHKAEHKDLMDRVNALLRQFMDGRSNLSVEVSGFLRNAMVPHIMTSDMEIARCIRPSK